MTLPVPELEHILSVAAAYRKKTEAEKTAAYDEADLVGVNMEGPFISKAKKGGADERNIIPCDAEIFRRFQRAADGLVSFIGIAPEEPGAITFVHEVKDEVNVSLAHTNSDYAHAMAAFEAGANHAVHLYNAMPPFSHRAPGVVGAVSDSEQVMAELICDGVHVDPAVVRATFKMLGAEPYDSDQRQYACGRHAGRTVYAWRTGCESAGQPCNARIRRCAGGLRDDAAGLHARSSKTDGDPV